MYCNVFFFFVFFIFFRLSQSNAAKAMQCDEALPFILFLKFSDEHEFFVVSRLFPAIN